MGNEIIKEVRIELDEEEIQRVKRHVKSLLLRQSAIQKNIANFEDELTDIQNQLDLIDNGDFSCVPTNHCWANSITNSTSIGTNLSTLLTTQCQR